MNALFDLSGKVAIVTGANAGIGQAIAVALAGAGASVALVGRTKATESLAQITAMGRKALCVAADLSTIEPVERIVAETVMGLGRLDILVNNAGIIRRDDSVDFTEADWDAVMDTNLKSLFFLSQAAAKFMLSAVRTETESGANSGKGKIINIASMLSFQGGVRVPSYTASKSGVSGLTKAMANEWSARGINVNAIAPGYIQTNNTKALQADLVRNQQIVARIPAGRWGNAEDIGGAAVFLASRASDYVAGHILAVDGGWLAS